MPKVISIHEYVLKPGVDVKEFENAIRSAIELGLLTLPGLIGYYFVKGIRGDRKDLYAAIWIYESKEAWEKLWGPIDDPISKKDYPKTWKVWEKEVLAPFLVQDPHEIKFSSYQEL